MPGPSLKFDKAVTTKQRSIIQWGFEIRPFETLKHLKSGLFEGRISNSWALAMALVPTI